MANDFLTLGEIEGQHETMMERVLAKSWCREFVGIDKAMNFVFWAVDRALKLLKVNIDNKMPEQVIQTIMEQKKLKVEQHVETDHPGTYIYIDDELQFFISNPEIKKSQIIIHEPSWIVRSNVK